MCKGGEERVRECVGRKRRAGLGTREKRVRKERGTSGEGQKGGERDKRGEGVEGRKSVIE